jgi:hypothetical protein
VRFPFLPVAGVSVVAAGAVLRILALLRLASPSAEWTGDARVYLRIAEGIPAGHWLPEAWIWPPGYPLLGALLSPLGTGPGLLAVSLLSGIALPILALVAGRAAEHPRVGLGAAALLAFLPAPILASAQPLSDSLALLLVAGGAMLLLRAVSRRSVGLGVAAGVTAALAVLTRPESLLAFVAVPFAMGLRRPGRRPMLAYAATAALLLAPYALAFHAVTGAWGVSLKAHLNLRKVAIYSAQADYSESRAAWGRELDGMRDPDGNLDPERIAHAADPASFVREGDFLAWWLDHSRQAIVATPRALTAGFALALIALFLPGPGRRERRIAALLSLPFLVVPVFLVPIGRFTLPLLPAVAWGSGVILSRTTARARPALRSVLIGGVLAVAAALSFPAARAQARDVLWGTRSANIQAALGEQRLDEADRWLQPFVSEDRAEVLVLLARLREAQGRGPEADDAFRRLAGTGGSPLPWATRLARTGRAAAAEEVLAPMLTAEADAETWMTAGNVAFLNERYDVAADRFARAEALGAPPGEAAYNRAMALVRADRPEEAATAARRAARTGTEATARRANALLQGLPPETAATP